MKTLIDVTEIDIKKGKRNNPEKDPIAHAVRRTLKIPKQTYISVGYGNIVIDDGKALQFINYPRSVTRFIRSYDQKQPVQPFRFYLDPEKPAVSYVRP